MDIDVVEGLRVVDRRVAARDKDGHQVRVVVAQRTYDTEVEDLWDAVTNPERIPRWFLPVSGDLRPGGHYQLEGNAGGTISDCQAPTRLAVTWEYGGEVSWLALTLTGLSNGGTRLELEHTARVDDERWTEFGPGAVGVGWDLALLGLAEHVSTGVAVDPDAAAQWSMSPEGVAFVRGSSEAWGRAAIAAGETEEQATAAADRTTAFYTGTPSEDGQDPSG